MTEPGHNILSDILDGVGVSHTPDYTAQRLATMPFQSVFGLKKLLEEYGIDSDGLIVDDKSEFAQLRPPFMAQTSSGFVIVTKVKANDVEYLTQGSEEHIEVSDFIDAWTGMVLMLSPRHDASEPDFRAHKVQEIGAKVKNWVLIVSIVALIAYALIFNGIIYHWSMCLILLLDLSGLWLTWLLVQKSLKISNATADSMCRILQDGGCDDVLEMKASKFFGLFGWSEVGFSYFSISFLTLLIVPDWIHYLALCNVICLPFTVWSIWYQKYKAGVWCTLCVSVQCTLWFLFFCYLGGDWIHFTWPPQIGFFVLCALYVSALLAINRLTNYIQTTK